jgi:hypothetical protein
MRKKTVEFEAEASRIQYCLYKTKLRQKQDCKDKGIADQGEIARGLVESVMY